MIRNRNLVFSKANDSSKAADKYVEIPRIAVASAATAATAINGALYYDTTNNLLKVVINGSWATVTTS